MPLRSIFQKRSIFLLYWLLILPLAGYLAYDRYTDRFDALAPVLENTVSHGARSTRRANEWRLTDIYKWSDAFPTPDNEILRQQAVAARSQADSCQYLIRAVQAKSHIDQTGELNRTATSLRQLADTLLVFAGQGSIIATNLNALLFHPATELQTPETVDFFKNASTAQTKLYLDDQIWKTELALQLVLSDIYGRIDYDEIRFDDYLPVLEIENCALAGKPFSGNISLYGYSKLAENIQYFVNGREYESNAGLVHYPDRFSKPGVYTRQLKVQVINPLTKEIKMYMKDFNIAIQQP